MVDALEIGYAIKKRRLQLGLTQAQIAEAAGISKRCLWSLELGQNHGVQLDKLTAVLGVLGLSLELTAGNTPIGLELKTAEKSIDVAAQASPKRNLDEGFDALAILTGEAR